MERQYRHFAPSVCQWIEYEIKNLQQLRTREEEDNPSSSSLHYPCPVSVSSILPTWSSLAIRMIYSIFDVDLDGTLNAKELETFENAIETDVYHHSATDASSNPSGEGLFKFRRNTSLTPDQMKYIYENLGNAIFLQDLNHLDFGCLFTSVRSSSSSSIGDRPSSSNRKKKQRQDLKDIMSLYRSFQLLGQEILESKQHHTLAVNHQKEWLDHRDTLTDQIMRQNDTIQELQVQSQKLEDQILSERQNHREAQRQLETTQEAVVGMSKLLHECVYHSSL